MSRKKCFSCSAFKRSEVFWGDDGDGDILGNVVTFFVRLRRRNLCVKANNLPTGGSQTVNDQQQRKRECRK